MKLSERLKAYFGGFRTTPESWGQDIVEQTEVLEARSEKLRSLEAESEPGRRVTFDELRPGMVIYEAPTEFDILEKSKQIRFVVGDTTNFVIYSPCFSRDNYRVNDAQMLEEHDYYTTWEAALLRAYDLNDKVSMDLINHRQKITDAIDKERNENT